MGAINAAIRSIKAGFFTPPPAATTSSIGGPSWAHWRSPSAIVLAVNSVRVAIKSMS